MRGHGIFVPLDREFVDDTSGAILRAKCERIDKIARESRQALDRGVPPEQARILRLLVAASSAAGAVLPRLWQAQQKIGV